MLDLEKPTRIDHLLKKLVFIGDLDDGQKQKLKDIASKCPVHKTLLTETIIETEIIDN